MRVFKDVMFEDRKAPGMDLFYSDFIFLLSTCI